MRNFAKGMSASDAVSACGCLWAWNLSGDWNLQGLTSTPPRRCLAFGACNLEVVYCCQGLKDEIFKLRKVPRYPSCRPGGVDASETAAQLRSECLRRVGELDNEISTRALEDTERFNGKEISFVCFWIHFFLQSFSVELIKKLLVSWRLWNHFATRNWSLMDIAAVLKLPPATHWMRRGTTHHSGQPKQLGCFSRIQKAVQNHRWNFGVKKLQIYNSSILSWISSCIWIFPPQVVSENPKRHCRLRPPLTLDPSSLETEIRLATRKHELKSELMEMFARFGMDYWWIVDEFMIHVPVF